MPRAYMETRILSQEDVESIWTINEQGLPGTGQVSKQEISTLLEISTLSFGEFRDEELIGFVICLSPGTDYGSLNYAWFNERLESFIYVDRIAVSKNHRGEGVGSQLYDRVISYSNENKIPIAAEVNLEPPNPGSMRFHRRFDFKEVGVLRHRDKSVTMLLRNNSH